MFNKCVSKFAICLIGLFAAVSSVQAIPITYKLVNVAFTDGGTATGSFVYDKALNKFGDFDIKTAGPLLGAFNYTDVNSSMFLNVGVGYWFFGAMRDDGRRVFRLSPVSPVTDAGGAYLLSKADTYECNNCGTYRRIVSGSLDSTQIPEPATGILIASMLGLMAVVRRRTQVAP